MNLSEDTVYALIPPPQHTRTRPPPHKSAFPGSLDRRTLVYPMGVAKVTNSHATFGCPDGCSARSPSGFVRAHSGEPKLPAPAPPKARKPKVKGRTPTRSEFPSLNLASGKNFVTSNAVEVILSKPKAQAEVLPFTMKADYGKIPKYLGLNKRKVAQEQAQVEEYLKMRDAQDCPSNVGQLSQQEREELLGHLKSKWSTVNSAYQKMTFTLDTPTKKKRKETYEQQLAEIEKDIRLLERGDVVLVVDD